ncbi:SLATT domain-containing protein, partial [Klebsiella pneumoniae]|uniref:SLATT domain-containing protein n=1 Tax=Klebsiella pneumoniae TaxID=573 RepID=UPI0029D54AF3
KLNFNQRLDLYLQDRVQNQQDWYSDKSEYNRKSESFLFVVSFLFQFLSIIYILVLVNQNWTINITGILSALATVTITWLQVKQHQELAQAYGLAAQELTSIYSMSFEVNSADSLSEYVNESENSISREHTLWVARRGQ